VDLAFRRNYHQPHQKRNLRHPERSRRISCPHPPSITNVSRHPGFPLQSTPLPRKLKMTLNQKDSPMRVLFSFRYQGPRTHAPSPACRSFSSRGTNAPKALRKLVSFPRGNHERPTVDPPWYRGTNLPCAEEHRTSRFCIRARVQAACGKSRPRKENRAQRL
jgi:hypothetical protein